jgi:energy-coupling factor transporter ATP-binding protein EcfA2
VPNTTIRSTPGISMLGATGSGKTTFLGALHIALLRKREQDPAQEWVLWARDEASRQLLVKMDVMLNSEGKFPMPTETIESLDWILDGRTRRTEKAGRWRAPQEFEDRLEVTLKLTDPSGEFMQSTYMAAPQRQQLVEHVINSRGILFMFDPVREHRWGDAYDTTFNVIMDLIAAASSDPGFDGRLPHHVAVCVTKLDEPRVFKTAESLHLLTQNPHHPYNFPTVHHTDARTLLQHLCKVGRNGAGAVLPQLLENYFHPERITYYATSAVGFMLDKRTRKFNPHDTENFYRTASRKAVVRGPVNPVNVVEPVLWLVNQTAQLA